jgi:hypothetical protein
METEHQSLLARLEGFLGRRYVWYLLWHGLYPPVVDRGVPPDAWYADYFATYVERDVRQLINVRDLAPFRTFVRMCAARSAQTVQGAQALLLRQRAGCVARGPAFGAGAGVVLAARAPVRNLGHR